MEMNNRASSTSPPPSAPERSPSPSPNWDFSDLLANGSVEGSRSGRSRMVSIWEQDVDAGSKNGSVMVMGPPAKAAPPSSGVDVTVAVLQPQQSEGDISGEGGDESVSKDTDTAGVKEDEPLTLTPTSTPEWIGIEETVETVSDTATPPKKSRSIFEIPPPPLFPKPSYKIRRIRRDTRRDFQFLVPSPPPAQAPAPAKYPPPRPSPPGQRQSEDEGIIEVEVLSLSDSEMFS